MCVYIYVCVRICEYIYPWLTETGHGSLIRDIYKTGVQVPTASVFNSWIALLLKHLFKSGTKATNKQPTVCCIFSAASLVLQLLKIQQTRSWCGFECDFRILERMVSDIIVKSEMSHSRVTWLTGTWRDSLTRDIHKTRMDVPRAGVSTNERHFSQLWHDSLVRDVTHWYITWLTDTWNL